MSALYNGALFALLARPADRIDPVAVRDLAGAMVCGVGQRAAGPAA
ncbi:hypothetical protein [Streptomonospora sp. PA3]|nr:hypothetical protein [Streptomonospora sp. PA3]